MKRFQMFIPPIISVSIFIVVALLMSSIPIFQIKIDEYFYAAIFGGPLSILLTYGVWTPTGEQKAKDTKTIKINTAIYNARANHIISKQLFKELKSFCDYKNYELKKEIIKDKLSTVVIGYDIYELYIKINKDEKEKEALENILLTLDKRQLKILKRLKDKDIKCEKLVPKNLTIGKVRKYELVPENKEYSYKISRMVFKSFWGIAVTCFTYFVTIQPNPSFGIPQIIMIIMWLFTFLLSIYSAIKTGYNSIMKYRNTYLLKQSELCAEFFKFSNTEFASVDTAAISHINDITEEPIIKHKHKSSIDTDEQKET